MESAITIISAVIVIVIGIRPVGMNRDRRRDRSEAETRPKICRRRGPTVEVCGAMKFPTIRYDTIPKLDISI